MNGQKMRILAGCLAGFAIVTAIYVLMTKTPIVHFAYFTLMLSVVLSGGTLWMISEGGKKKYFTNLAFPGALVGYLIATIAMAVVFCLLDAGEISIGLKYYCVLYIIVLALTLWRLLVLGAGQEKILEIEEKTKIQTSSWRVLQADAESILRAAPSDLRSDVSAVRDAIRYGDPMSIPEVAEIESSVSADLMMLKTVVAEGNSSEAKALCAKIQNSVKDRATRLKLLK